MKVNSLVFSETKGTVPAVPPCEGGLSGRQGKDGMAEEGVLAERPDGKQEHALSGSSSGMMRHWH
jgi:hypothetical protein